MKAREEREKKRTRAKQRGRTVKRPFSSPKIRETVPRDHKGEGGAQKKAVE